MVRTTKNATTSSSAILKMVRGKRGKYDLDRVPEHPYPKLRQVLEVFLTGIQDELKDNLIGFYLVGSFATGGFDLDSDVDFLVVTKRDLSEANVERLQEIQRAIHALDVYPAQHLEGSYFPINDLNDLQTIGEKKLYYFDNGSTTFEQTTHDNNWHVRWVLRERGITLLGKEPKTFLQPIPKEALFEEMETSMRQHIGTFEEAISKPLNFMNSQFGQPFIVLTYCRMLHTLHTGTVQSKKAGAEWAKTVMDPKWVKLIEQAWRDREGVRFCVKIGLRADDELLHQTLLFMKYVRALAETLKN